MGFNDSSEARWVKVSGGDGLAYRGGFKAQKEGERE